MLIVRQDRIEAELAIGPAWDSRTLTDPEARIVLPDLGDIGRLTDLYRSTPLAVG